MKKEFLSLCFLALSVCAFAQTEKNIIYECIPGDITYVQPQEQKKSAAKTAASIAGNVLMALGGEASVKTDHPEYVENVKQAITGGIGSSRRVRMVDEATGQNPALTLEGTISAITTTQRTHVWKDSNKKTHSDLEYSANITGNITIKVASTGEVVFNQPISKTGYDWGWLSSSDEALSSAVAYVRNYVLANINLAFPLFANIVEGAAAKKDKQKEVYIDLGEPAGVYKGLNFYVYQVTTVAGKEAKKEIGRIKVTEVMGDEISLCKVVKGGSDIKEAIDEGKTLQIMSRD